MRLSILILSVILTIYCSDIRAEEHVHEEVPYNHPHDGEIEHESAAEHHHGHPHHAIALIGVYAAGIPKGESVLHHGGFGVAYHTGLIPEKLELEIALKAVFAGEHHHYPLEIALKIPFELTESSFLSLGLGPVIALHQHGDEVGMAFGGGVGAEISHWYKPWGGMVAAVAYELLYHDHIINKFVLVAGPAFGW